MRDLQHGVLAIKTTLTPHLRICPYKRFKCRFTQLDTLSALRAAHKRLFMTLSAGIKIIRCDKPRSMHINIYIYIYILLYIVYIYTIVKP